MNGIKKANKQQGMASIVVVGVLVVLLTLITVGFSVIMNRAVNNSVNNQQAAAANYAAQSGINDVVNFIKDPAHKGVDFSSSTCDGYSKAPHNISSQLQLSSNTSTVINCVLVDPSPTDLVYQPLQPNSSQILVIDPQAPKNLNKILISWKSADGKSLNNTTGLPAQPSWDNIPLLRITIYPVGSGTQKIYDNESKTFFLKPSQGAGAITSNSFSAADGSLFTVNCKTASSPGNPFGLSLDHSYDCFAMFTGFPATDDNGLPVGYYAVRVTPLYDQAGVKIQASDSGGGFVSYAGQQTSIDVTAKSGNAVKRLQERVDADTTGTSINNYSAQTLPESALRTTNTICKRIDVNGTTDFSLDAGTSATNCNGPPSSAPIVLTYAPPDQAYPNVTLKGNVDPNGSTVTGCGFYAGLSVKNNAIQNPVNLKCGPPCTIKQFNPNGPKIYSCDITSKTDVPATLDLSAQAAAYKKFGTTIYYQAFASNGTIATGGVQRFAVDPPDPTATTTNATIIGPTSVKLYGKVNPNGSAVNAIQPNYPGSSPQKYPISGCFFTFYDNSNPGDLKHISCSKNPGAGSKDVIVSQTLKNLISGHLYKYQMCASKENINAQGLPYGHTICDPTWSSFIPEAVPVLTTSTVNSGAMVKYQTSGSTLPQVTYSGTIQTNASNWVIESCVFYWNRENVNSPPDPLQNNHHPNCNENLATLSQTTTKQTVTATDDLSAAYSSGWNNQWYIYEDHASAHQSNADGFWSSYGPSPMCFQAGKAGTNKAFSSGKDGNCGQVCNCNGCGIGSAPGSCDTSDSSGGPSGGGASCDTPSFQYFGPNVDSQASPALQDYNINVSGKCTDGSTKLNYGGNCNTNATDFRGGHNVNRGFGNNSQFSPIAASCYDYSDSFSGHSWSETFTLSGSAVFVDSSGNQGPPGTISHTDTLSGG